MRFGSDGTPLVLVLAVWYTFQVMMSILLNYESGETHSLRFP